jgi:shikimate dehydrogenase
MDLYGLIGNPVSQSLSEKYFTGKFMLEDIDARFERYLLKDIDELPGLIRRHPDLRGLSVTSPFKTGVVSRCDELDETAGMIKAVNTLKISRQGTNIHIKGYNTDVDGFAAALLPLLGKEKPSALVLGSGGAARAVAFALHKLGLVCRVVSRTAGRGKITYADLSPEIIRSDRLIINATPMGMGSLAGMLPGIPYEHIGQRHLLFDLIYNPPETAFLREGKRRGARTENGFLMLQAQAEKAWGIWKA